MWDNERIDAAINGFVEARAVCPPAAVPVSAVPSPAAPGDALAARAAQIALKVSMRQT
jgi:hypothetical protein